MTHKDVQPPEFIIDGMRSDGKVQKVPFLYQREGETWDQFCDRMKRVSDSLNDHQPIIERDGVPIFPLIILVLIGLVMWWGIWRLFL